MVDIYPQQLIFTESFNDTMDWIQVPSSPKRFQIHDNLFHIQSINEALLFCHSKQNYYQSLKDDVYNMDTLSLNESNFILDITVRKLGGDNNGFYGMWFFLNEQFSNCEIYSDSLFQKPHISFEINNQGHYQIYIVNKNLRSNYPYWPVSILAKGKSPYIQRLNKQNDLSFKSINGRLLFFINDSYITEIELEKYKLKGDVCFYSSGQLNIQLKKFRFYRLNSSRQAFGNIQFNETFFDNTNNWDEIDETNQGAFLDHGVLTMNSFDTIKEIYVKVPYEFVLKSNKDFLFSFDFSITDGKLELVFIDGEENKMILLTESTLDSIYIKISPSNYFSVFKSNLIRNMKGWNELVIRRLSNSLIFLLNQHEITRTDNNDIGFNKILFHPSISKIATSIIQDKPPSESTRDNPPIKTKIPENEFHTFYMCGAIDNIQFYETIFPTCIDAEGPTLTLSSQFPLDGNIISEKDTFLVQGFMTDESGIADLRISNKKVHFNYNGSFEFPIPLRTGYDTITIKATDYLGNTTFDKKAIKFTKIYKPRNPGINKFGGRNFLFFIAIDKYPGADTLQSCVKDANDIIKVLLSQYKFSKEYVIKLFDAKATRQNILDTLRKLINIIGKNDNLLIYYSGHGFYDPVLNEGYWIPVDAHKGKTSDFFSNLTILNVITQMTAMNVLLISDACFSGSIFPSIKQFSPNENIIEHSKSRWVLTSGRHQTVRDGDRGKNGLFAAMIINYLKDNKEQYISIYELGQFVKEKVKQKCKQEPRCEPLPPSYGHEGGEYYFYKQ